MAKEKVGFEEIEKFLVGKDPQKYIVAIEASYYENFVSLVINDPEKGKYIEKHTLKPFMWLKHDVVDLLYDGSKPKIKKAMRELKVKIKGLRIDDGEGNIPDRLANGYKYIATCDGSYGDLINFFKDGGCDVFSGDKINPEDEEDLRTYKSLFVRFSPDEQFLIQTGKRLFKGMDDYNDVHRFQFDLETHGLDPKVDPIFQIGIKDNRGYSLILETKGNTPKEERDSEKANIAKFFDVVAEICPDIITGFNSENFDWPYFRTRCERLGVDITKLAKTLNPKKKIRWKESMIKLGGEQENYEQTNMWGFNILDISHAVRRAQAINSDIKKWNLKYITEYSGVAKKNRVYVPGDKLHTIWADTAPYGFNDTDGTWYRNEEEKPLEEGYESVKGDYIVQRYLLDDLWETEQIDGIYNQAAYLIAKLLPTSYMRSSTMGTAGQWKLIMGAWSYENELGVPDTTPKRDFVGGLSRLLEVGFAKKVAKLDFAALYPKIQLTWGIFPSLDVSGVMEGLLTYVVDKRDEFKFLTGTHKGEAKKLQSILDEHKSSLSEDRINKAESMISDNKKQGSDFDKKQLPLKILANSFFGAYGAPYIFNWGDSDCAEETTCRGRQSLRLMVRHFTEKYNFRALVMDTDGANFAMPDEVEDVKYICTAEHWKTKSYGKGTELSGLDAVIAEFNENFMIGRMGLDVDDVCDATINFARKNYANLIDGKVKLVGNSIKSKAMPIYIEEFINAGIRLLLDNKGHEFIELYHKHVDDIYNYRVPVAKIASKSRVKMTRHNYKNVYCKAKNKAGRAKARRAHMELIEVHDLNVNLGDVIYYVNTGTAKSHSDIKTLKDKKNGTSEIQFNCKLIPIDEIERNPDYTTDEYNIPKYLENFNKRIKPLLVCFDTEIRDLIIIDVYKDKKTKVIKLEEKNLFTKSQCKLIAGKPFKPDDQDTYEDLMIMEDKEIRFWDDVDKLPNNIEQEEWDVVRADYKVRMQIIREEGIKAQTTRLRSVFQRLEINTFNNIRAGEVLPKEILVFSKIIDDEEGIYHFYSKEWDTNLVLFSEMFDYEEDAKKRDRYYKSLTGDIEDGCEYEMWKEYESNLSIRSEDYSDPEAYMFQFLKDNKWRHADICDKTMWLPQDGDFNRDKGFTIVDAYLSELNSQRALELARNRPKEQLVIKFDEDVKGDK